MNTESREPINDAEHAPPRTLWYHATLGAEEASSYLAQRHPGSYLVRKSPKHADSYRLSVVDANHKIVHFTIELKYGLVLLGAQSFTSLSALVSHFASKGQLFFDSQLLLVNPVPPSNYVQPHRVRVKLPYTQAPDTDELCVQFGEILIVHDQPEEDWIWAESLLTGHSGSVALDIVEPVPTSADPFLGYVWFNGERAKAELVADLSAPKCRVGTFIIRPSESPSTEADCTSYTILVRSKSQVEKLRLERHKSGRIHFGNRQFDTMSALFTRYAHSEIRPGASLCFPLPCLPPSPALPPPKIRLRRLSSSGPRTQKAGWVMVYSMKNAYTDVPNNGQWKKYWARLDSDRSKDALVLSFFESDKRSRPKQAFVLEHANYVRVSHSLFSKEAVLAVYQKSNENYGSWFKVCVAPPYQRVTTV